MCNSVRNYFSFVLPCEYSCLDGQRHELNLQTFKNKNTSGGEYCDCVCFLEQARAASGSCWGAPWQKLGRYRSGAGVKALGRAGTFRASVWAPVGGLLVTWPASEAFQSHSAGLLEKWR